jgi:hypothetical protein
MLLISRIERAAAEQRPVPELNRLVPACLVIFALLVLAIIASLALGARHVLALGYDIYTRRLVASALLSGPTARRALWKKPVVARALLPATAAGGDATAEPQSARDYASAIARAGGATGEAEALAAEIAALDAEIARLAADADAEEAARLREKLMALGSEAPDEGDERRERRRLLKEELELAARVESRLEEARGRRQARLHALRELWRSVTPPAAGDTGAPTRTASG